METKMSQQVQHISHCACNSNGIEGERQEGKEGERKGGERLRAREYFKIYTHPLQIAIIVQEIQWKRQDTAVK